MDIIMEETKEMEEANFRCSQSVNHIIQLKLHGRTYSLFVKGICLAYGMDAKEASFSHQIAMLTWDKIKA